MTNSIEVLNTINANIDYATKAVLKSSRGKTFVLLSHGKIFSFHKTNRGAVSSMSKYNSSYYDDYSQTMVKGASGMEIVEICVLDIVDYSTDTNIWFETMLSRWKINQSNTYLLTQANEIGCSAEIVTLIENVLANSDTNSFPSREMLGLEASKIEIEVIEDAVTVEEQPVAVETEITTIQSEITYKLNDKKNGIEIYFATIPNEDVRNQLKSNGFKWSRFNKCWYAKQSIETIAVAEKLSNNETVEVNSTIDTLKVVSTEIEIVEFVNVADFTINVETEKRLIDNSLFSGKRKVGQETDSLRFTLNELLEKTKSVIELTTSGYDISKLIKGFNSFCVKYSNGLNSYLYQKSVNPGWVVTGRGGLNIARYNKKQEQLNNKMLKVVEMLENQRSYLDKQERKFKDNIKSRELMIINSEINSLSVDDVKFKTVNRSMEYYGYTYNNRSYESNTYFTMKMAGCYRIFELSTGIEVHSMKTKDTLKDTKLYMIYLERNKK